jgi:hypothetical protein
MGLNVRLRGNGRIGNGRDNLAPSSMTGRDGNSKSPGVKGRNVVDVEEVWTRIGTALGSERVWGGRGSLKSSKSSDIVAKVEVKD